MMFLPAQIAFEDIPRPAPEKPAERFLIPAARDVAGCPPVSAALLSSSRSHVPLTGREPVGVDSVPRRPTSVSAGDDPITLPPLDVSRVTS
jgi:hypothetical protein